MTQREKDIKIMKLLLKHMCQKKYITNSGMLTPLGVGLMYHQRLDPIINTLFPQTDKVINNIQDIENEMKLMCKSYGINFRIHVYICFGSVEYLKNHTYYTQFADGSIKGCLDYVL